jgi:hypothetical protein
MKKKRRKILFITEIKEKKTIKDEVSFGFERCRCLRKRGGNEMRLIIGEVGWICADGWV